jgi:two-component system response regulator AtoC
MRVVAATNMDPQRAVDEGKLRHDLFFRLNVLRIDVPLLRDRGGDIPLLAEHFLRKYASELGYVAPRLSRPVLERLESYAWPGNVRELENLMERAAVLSGGSEVRLEHLPENITHEHRESAAVERREPIGPQVGSLKTRVEALEMELIKAALAQSDNNKSAAARVLEISERALWYKIKRYGID